MKREIEQAGERGMRTRRSKRRINGMAKTAGIPDLPTRGKFARAIALVNAALRVWEANQPRRATVWRHESADSPLINRAKSA